MQLILVIFKRYEIGQLTTTTLSENTYLIYLLSKMYINIFLLIYLNIITVTHLVLPKQSTLYSCS